MKPAFRGAPFQFGWANALLIWALSSLVLGLGCFVVVGRALRELSDRFWAAVYWQLAFAVGLAILLGVVMVCLRQRGQSLRDIGWRLPTSKSAIVVGIGLGLLYTTGVYAGILSDPAMRGVDPFALIGSVSRSCPSEF